MKRIFNIALLAFLCLNISCGKDDEPGGTLGEEKIIEWEMLMDLGDGVRSFAITDDANFLFYTNSAGRFYRVNTATNQETEILSGISKSGVGFVNVINGIVYGTYVSNGRGYFAVSTDLGDTFAEHQVGVFTNVPAGQYEGAFIRPVLNRLYQLPNGQLMIPHIYDNTNSNNMPNDSKLIVVSDDGGATWERRNSEHSFISALRGNTLYAASLNWLGDFNIGEKGNLYESNDYGATWKESSLLFAPQAVDRENNLVAADYYKVCKLKNNKWISYEAEEGATHSPLVSNVVYSNTLGNVNKKLADIQFDLANNIYVLSANRIYKSRLD